MALKFFLFQGADPFASVEQRGPKTRQQKEDPEFVAFGSWLRENLVYVFMAGFIVSSAFSYNLISASFSTMQTPAVLAFLHSLAAAASITLGSHFDVFQPLQMTVNGLRGAAPCTFFYSTQLLCLFSSLHHNSVHLVIAWISVGGAFMDTLVALLTGDSSQSLSQPARTALLVAFGAGCLEILFDSNKAMLGILMLLLWSLSRGVECIWNQLLVDSTLGGRLNDFKLVGWIRDLTEDQLTLTRNSRSTIFLLQNLIPAPFILILGLIFGEGKELVDHEPTVPGLKIMLWACAFYAASQCCLLILNDRHLVDSSSTLESNGAREGVQPSEGRVRRKPPSSVLRSVLRAASFSGGIILYTIEMPITLSSSLTSLLALTAVLSSHYSVVSSWRREKDLGLGSSSGLPR